MLSQCQSQLLDENAVKLDVPLTNTGVTMIRSMTAFARKDAQGDWGTLTCEIRTVNHRYLEPSFRLPEAFRELENRFRGLLNQVRKI